MKIIFSLSYDDDASQLTYKQILEKKILSESVTHLKVFEKQYSFCPLIYFQALAIFPILLW